MPPGCSAAAALLLLLAAAAHAADHGCGVCHGAERVLHGESVHAGADLTCVDCHGGDVAIVCMSWRILKLEGATGYSLFLT